MSWLEDIQKDFIITTGDGAEYRPKWLNASKTKEYNVSLFNFVDIDGTLVERRSPKGRKYNIEIHFTGDDNIQDAESFEISADDSRSWTISHPFYGRIAVQPISLFFDNTSYNVTKITGTVIETIEQDSPQGTISLKDKIEVDKEDLDVVFEESFATDIPAPTTLDINNLADNNEAFYNEGTSIISETTDSEEYFDLFNTANADILEATSEPLAAIRSLQAVINAPALFQSGIEDRINLFIEQIDTLVDQLPDIDDVAEKKIFENNVGIAISAMALASVNPIQGDYESKSGVVSIIDKIMDTYNSYLTNLDSLQSDNGGDEDSYIPDYASLISLNSLIDFTLANLLLIVLDGQQERILILDEDSNLVKLTHRLYGLDAEDEQIERFVNINDIGLNEFLLIKKGRRIIYYI